jgi:uncharacterized lipoprotein
MKPLGWIALSAMTLTLAACGVSGGVLPNAARDGSTLKAVPIDPSPAPSGAPIHGSTLKAVPIPDPSPSGEPVHGEGHNPHD